MISLTGKRKITKSTKLILSRTILGLAVAAIDTIWAIYMKEFNLSNHEIGFISGGLVALSFFAALIATPLMEKYKETKLFMFFILIQGLSYILISFSKSLLTFMILASILTLGLTIQGNAFSIIFRDNTKDKELNKKQGFMYSMVNLGWLIGPLIAGFILTKGSMKLVFLIAGLITIFSLLTFKSINLKNINKKRKTIDGNFKKNVIDFLKNKKLRAPYIMAMGVAGWWAFVYIYMPLFAIEKGLGGKEISIFISALVVPLALTEFKIGKLSEKHGLKKFFLIGYLGLTAICISLFFIQNIYMQLGLVVLGSFFVATIEPLQETFFYKRVIKIDEEKYRPLFGTAWNTGNFLSKIIIAGIIFFLSGKFAYLGMASLMLLLLISTTKIKE